MKHVKSALVVAAVIGTGAVAARRSRSRTAAGDPADRWLTVTVNRAPTDVMSGGALPAPLTGWPTGWRPAYGPPPATGARNSRCA